MTTDLHHHILGVYSSREAAQQAMSRLLELGLDREQLNLIEPGDVPVGEPVRLDARALVTNMNLNGVDLNGERVFSDIVKQALLEGQVVVAGHTTTEAQTARAQEVLNQSMRH
jgi:hypothetical protein